MILCPTCRKLVYRTDACKGSDVVCGRTDGGSRPVAGARAQPGMSGGGAVVSAPDTGREVGGSNPPSPVKSVGVAAKAEQVKRGAEPAPIAPAVDLTTQGTPRKRAPKGTFDRKAYQREKARERRARLKLAKPSEDQDD